MALKTTLCAVLTVHHTLPPARPEEGEHFRNRAKGREGYQSEKSRKYLFSGSGTHFDTIIRHVRGTHTDKATTEKLGCHFYALAK